MSRVGLSTGSRMRQSSGIGTQRGTGHYYDSNHLRISSVAVLDTCRIYLTEVSYDIKMFTCG